MRQFFPCNSTLLYSKLFQFSDFQLATSRALLQSLKMLNSPVLQSSNLVEKLLTNSLATHSDVFKTVSSTYLSKLLVSDSATSLSKLLVSDKAVFSSAMQGLLASLNASPVLNAAKDTYLSHVTNGHLNADWLKIALFSNPTSALFSKVLASVGNVQGLSTVNTEDMPKLPQKIEDEILKTARTTDEYLFLFSKKHNISPLFLFVLLCVIQILVGVAINKFSQANDNSEVIIAEIRRLRESFEQNMPKHPNGYLREVTRKVKFLSKDNHVIFLNPGDNIFVEYDANRQVCGTVVIGGKFIKGHCLKKYTKRITDAGGKP